MISVEAASPRSEEALALLNALSDTLALITGDSGRGSFDIPDVEQEGALFVIARSETGEAIGCGAMRPLRPAICEIKRMYARPGSKGVGRALLAFIEKQARAMGYREAWLETRMVNKRAVSFYEAAGYRRIPNFGKYAGRPEAVCFAKLLAQ